MESVIAKQQVQIDALMKKVEEMEQKISVYERSYADNEPIKYEPLFPVKTRKCGLCGRIGHYRNNCPSTTCFPKKKTSTWNATHLNLAKYKCDKCGKQETNKCNLDRHIKNNHK